MNEKLSVAYEEKARLLYCSEASQSLCNTFVASSIAWFSLYLSLALSSGDAVFSIAAIVGCIILPIAAIGWYRKGKFEARNAAMIEANIYSTK
ncbi:hypothetical protein KW439_00215 [Vibrio fluvialis]|nr:hypothetical protein [Vibrio fluvialis]